MSDLQDRPTLAVIGSMELFSRGEFRILDECDLSVRDQTIRVYLVAGDGGNFWAITRSGGRRIFAHAIDYRANVDALLELGVHEIVSTAMVGSLRPSIAVGSLLLVDQFIDFTTLTPHTYFEDDLYRDFDFSDPYCSRLRAACAQAARTAKVGLASESSCYVGSDGPRFETAAEVRAFAMLGGDVVGMTGVAECICARELGLCFSTIAGVVNMAAGLNAGPLQGTDFIDRRNTLTAQLSQVIYHLPAVLQNIDPDVRCVTCRNAELLNQAAGVTGARQSS